jgi:hypothetical protein
MSRRRKILTVAGIWLGVGLVVALALVAHPPTAAADGRGAVAVCNWENYEAYGHGGLNWRWVACNHTLHGQPYHSQWRGGLGTPGHTVDRYKREAAAFRAYTGAG